MIHFEIISGDYSSNDKIRGYISYIDSIEKNYQKKIVKYITKYFEDPITLFPEAVERFNANKLFKEIPDMPQKNVSEFVSFEDEDGYMQKVTLEREIFLLKHGINI